MRTGWINSLKLLGLPFATFEKEITQFLIWISLKHYPKHILGCVLMCKVISTCAVKIPHTPMMQRILKTAEPTIVPTPTSPLVINTPAQRRQGGLQRACEGPRSNVWGNVFQKRAVFGDVYLWLRWRVQELNFLLPWTWLLLHPRWDGGATTRLHTERESDIKDEENRTQAKIMTNLEFPEQCSHLSLVRKHKYLILILKSSYDYYKK